MLPFLLLFCDYHIGKMTSLERIALRLNSDGNLGYKKKGKKIEFPLLSVLKCHPIIRSCMEGEKDYRCSLKITMFTSEWFSEMYIFGEKATCALKGMDKKG